MELPKLDCPHRPPCGACPRFGAPGIAPRAAAGLDDLAHAHGIAGAAVTVGTLSGFRHRARLAIRGRVGAPKVGLFQPDSHRVVHIPRCVVHHPLINRAAGVVRRALADTRLTSYSDAAHLGVARHLQVVVERSSQTAQMVLVVNVADERALSTCLDLVRERLGDELHSLWLNFNRERTNVVMGSEFRRWCGPESVEERFGGPAIHYPPGAFGQSNLEIAGLIVDAVRARIPAGARVMEYYAGVGAIGLSVAAASGSLCLNEVSPHSLRGLDLGLAGLDPALRARIRVLPGAAGESCHAAPESDVVIVDPPRKGLDPQLLEHLREHPPERLLYVSCSLDSLRRDAGRLVDAGRLRLASLAAFDLLPFTEHVETLAGFERA